MHLMIEELFETIPNHPLYHDPSQYVHQVCLKFWLRSIFDLVCLQVHQRRDKYHVTIFCHRFIIQSMTWAILLNHNKGVALRNIEKLKIRFGTISSPALYTLHNIYYITYKYVFLRSSAQNQLSYQMDQTQPQNNRFVSKKSHNQQLKSQNEDRHRNNDDQKPVWNWTRHHIIIIFL